MIQDLKLTGAGIFRSGNNKFEYPFTVQRQLSHVLFTIETDDSIFMDSGPWMLSGELANGLPIYAEDLLCCRVSGKERVTELTPLSSVSIGQALDVPPGEVLYPLVGMFEGEFTIEHSGWLIEVFGAGEDVELAGRRSKAWRIPLEGLTLRLRKQDTPLEGYHAKTRDVMLLLSLAQGNGVTSFRQIADWKGKGTLEIWREWTGSELGPGAIVPSFELKKLLEQTLPLLARLSPSEKSDVRLAVNYINLTGTGYLDTKLFQSMQAWEFLASSWVPKPELGEQEKALREKILEAYRSWNCNYSPKADPSGFWGSRLTFPFEWPKLKRRMETLAGSVGLDSSKLGIDFEALKNTRDSVAHTGKMPQNLKRSGKEDAYQLFHAARRGLQMLILLKLGYSGRIIAEEGGYKTFMEIRHFQSDKNDKKDCPCD